MQGRDSLFGNILENIMSNVDEADAQEAKIAEMVDFYGKVLEGSNPYDAIVKLAKEKEMKPEDVFEMLKAGGHVNTETLEELKISVDEKIGEPKAEKAPDMKPKGGSDHGTLKQVDAMGASVKHKPDTKMGGPASPKVKIGEPTAEKPKELKADKILGSTKKLEGKIPEEGKDKEEDKIKKLTEEGTSEYPLGGGYPSDARRAVGSSRTLDQGAWELFQKRLEDLTIEERADVNAWVKESMDEAIQKMSEGALAKEVDALSAAAKKALDAGEYDTAMDLVSRLAQVQAALPAKAEPVSTAPSIEEPMEEPEDNNKDVGDKNGVDEAKERGDCVFQSTNPKVADDKDHFPINTAAQARNALARANQYSSAPKWYKGSLDSLVKAVARAVKRKYKSIDVSKASETPGKG